VLDIVGDVVQPDDLTVVVIKRTAEAPAISSALR
jgi:hypothetical protein